ncbi:hypothetical protein E2C01_001329 [Portunus trituberculatus]|uniref:Transmembrane protein n=1 Tax=Portunus trituberculatus TaxID=210409 RepID=A0A5B7CHJ4_PORTR|nr:hypothetical protein [Portunus trituberculatus]
MTRETQGLLRRHRGRDTETEKALHSPLTCLIHLASLIFLLFFSSSFSSSSSSSAFPPRHFHTHAPKSTSVAFSSFLVYVCVNFLSLFPSLYPPSIIFSSFYLVHIASASCGPSPGPPQLLNVPCTSTKVQPGSAFP